MSDWVLLSMGVVDRIMLLAIVKSAGIEKLSTKLYREFVSVGSSLTRLAIIYRTHQCIGTLLSTVRFCSRAAAKRRQLSLESRTTCSLYSASPLGRSAIIREARKARWRSRVVEFSERIPLLTSAHCRSLSLSTGIKDAR